jgi:hypothetical protein
VTGAAYTLITSTFPQNKTAADDFLCATNDFATGEAAFNLGAAACRMVLTSRQNDGYNSNNNKTGCMPPGGRPGRARHVPRAALPRRVPGVRPGWRPEAAGLLARGRVQRRAPLPCSSPPVRLQGARSATTPGTSRSTRPRTSLA